MAAADPAGDRQEGHGDPECRPGGPQVTFSVHIPTEDTFTALQHVISKSLLSECYSALSHVSEDSVYPADKSNPDDCIVICEPTCRAELKVPCCAEYET